MNSKDQEDFLSRFNTFYDAVLREIAIKFSQQEAVSQMEILVLTRDLQRLSEIEWVNVRIAIHNVKEFSFSESPRESYLVLSNGLTISNTEDDLFFDFGYFDDLPTDPTRFTESKFYVIGDSFDWEVLPS